MMCQDGWRSIRIVCYAKLMRGSEINFYFAENAILRKNKKIGRRTTYKQRTFQL